MNNEYIYKVIILNMLKWTISRKPYVASFKIILFKGSSETIRKAPSIPWIELKDENIVQTYVKIYVLTLNFK